MKLGINIAIIIGAFASGAKADLVPVFFAGGQSNAKSTWASAIQAELRLIHHPNSLVVNVLHGGNGLFQWMDNGVPQQNYYDDAAALQNRIDLLIAEGNTPDFRGVFWFQGEADTGSFADMDFYESRFVDLIEQYNLDFSANVFATIMVIDADPDFALPPGRTQASIDRMREVHFQLGSRPGMTEVDTRGYDRYDVWHITAPELQRLGIESARAFVTSSTIPEPSGFVLLMLAAGPGVMNLRKRQ